MCIYIQYRIIYTLYTFIYTHTPIINIYNYKLSKTIHIYIYIYLQSPLIYLFTNIPGTSQFGAERGFPTWPAPPVAPTPSAGLPEEPWE